MPKRPLDAFCASDSDEEPTPTIRPRRLAIPRPSKNEEIPDYMTFSVATEPETETRPSGLKYAEIQTVSREEALETSLFESQKTSIGLSMMQKMGFLVGQSLGKHPAVAPTEPLSISLKNNKTGLGAKSTSAALQRAPNGNFDFRERMAKENRQMDSAKIVKKLQKVCFRLSGDEDKLLDGSLSAEHINVLWKAYVKELLETVKEKKRVRLFEDTESEKEPVKIEADRELQDHESTPVSERLDTLVAFARESYFYCIFCACAYSDVNDLHLHCPGPLEEDHV